MLADVVRVYVAQDGETGEFIASDFSRVRMLKHAARSTSEESLRECIFAAVYDGDLEFASGYDVVSFYVDAE